MAIAISGPPSSFDSDSTVRGSFATRSESVQPAPVSDVYVMTSSTPDGGAFSLPFEPLPLAHGEPTQDAMAQLAPEVFSWRDYLARYPDLRAAGLDTEQDAIAHWVAFGIAEGRDASPAPHAIPADGLTIGNEVVRLGVSQRTGGAINSLVHEGREYVNDFDHGRQLQVAWQMNLGGEGNNPTEGGSANDGVGPTTSSQVLTANVTDTGLSITSQPAWWLPAGDNGGSTALVSDQVLTKSVEVGVTIAGVLYPNIIRHDASVSFPDGAQAVALEMPTAYLQGDFAAHYIYDVDSGALMPQAAIDSNPDASGHIATAYSQDAIGPRRRPNPMVFATADDQHAFAIVPALPLPAGFDDQLLGRMSFPNTDPAQATQKMTVLLTASNVPAGGTLAATTYVIVGTLEDVRRAMEALYASAPRL